MHLKANNNSWIDPVGLTQDNAELAVELAKEEAELAEEERERSL